MRLKGLCSFLPLSFIFGSACSTLPPLKTVQNVDLDRYMGIWYVNAHIPLPPEKDCWNAIEFYERLPDSNGRKNIRNLFYCEMEGSKKESSAGDLNTKYSRKKPEPVATDGKKKVKFQAKAWVVDNDTNAEWKVQFFWPISFAYATLYISPDYQEIIVGHPSRNYLWIMSRKTEMSKIRIDELMAKVAGQGFDASKLRVVPYTPGFQMTNESLKAEY